MNKLNTIIRCTCIYSFLTLSLNLTGQDNAVKRTPFSVSDIPINNIDRETLSTQMNMQNIIIKDRKRLKFELINNYDFTDNEVESILLKIYQWHKASIAVVVSKQLQSHYKKSIIAEKFNLISLDQFLVKLYSKR